MEIKIDGRFRNNGMFYFAPTELFVGCFYELTPGPSLFALLIKRGRI
jgi:hypothetical protein